MADIDRERNRGWLKNKLADMKVTVHFDGIGNGVWNYEGIELAYVWDGEPIRFATGWYIAKRGHWAGRILAHHKKYRKWIQGEKGPVLTELPAIKKDYYFSEDEPETFALLLQNQIDRLNKILPDLRRREKEKEAHRRAQLPEWKIVELKNWTDIFGNSDEYPESGYITLENGTKAKWGRFTEVSTTAIPTGNSYSSYMGYKKSYPSSSKICKSCRIGIMTETALYCGNLVEGYSFAVDSVHKKDEIERISRFLGPLK